MKKFKEGKQFRRKGYDYSQEGFYFATICTKDRNLYFGDIKNGEMELSDIGVVADKCWMEIPIHFAMVVLDEYIVMPDHLHGIIQIKNNSVGTQDFVFLQSGFPQILGTQDFAFLQTTSHQEYQNKFGPQSKNLSSIIRGFKIGVTKFARNKNINQLWQSRFYDRIIRNDEELNKIRNYIINNPEKWESDKNNKENLFM